MISETNVSKVACRPFGARRNDGGSMACGIKAPDTAHHTHPDVKQVARIKALGDFLYEKLSASDKVTRIETRRSQ
jgi:hypothetical protein